MKLGKYGVCPLVEKHTSYVSIRFPTRKMGTILAANCIRHGYCLEMFDISADYFIRPELFCYAHFIC